MQKLEHDVPNGKMPSVIANSGATSHCSYKEDSFIHAGKSSPKVFHTPLGQIAKASIQAQLIHHVQEPARTVNTVPGLQNSSLLSISKFANANYVTVFTQ